MREYKQSRFLSRGIYFLNSELRTRFAAIKILNQDLIFSAVPFFDAGSVYHNFTDLGNINNTRISEGLGLRIVWNQNTILRFDYAM